MSFFDSIYHYLLSIDNDCIQKEQRDEIFFHLEKIFNRKREIGRLEFMRRNKDILLEREIVKEIGITMLLDYENKGTKSIFFNEMKQSKEHHTFKKYIYHPSLKLI